MYPTEAPELVCVCKSAFVNADLQRLYFLQNSVDVDPVHSVTENDLPQITDVSNSSFLPLLTYQSYYTDHK